MEWGRPVKNGKRLFEQERRAAIPIVWPKDTGSEKEYYGDRSYQILEFSIGTVIGP
jgi:hypothetical protein